MTYQPLKAAVAGLVLSAGMTVTLSANASSVEQVLSASKSTINSSKASQQRIDKMAEQTSDSLGKYRAVNDQIDNLELYNELLVAKVERRRKALTDIQNSLVQIERIKRFVEPLALKMLDSLEQFIELDMPFRKEARLELIEDIRTRDVKSSEKVRQVLDAYDIEADYGRGLTIYDANLDIDGEPRPVTMVAVGRLALLYQTADTAYTGAYDKASGQFVDLGSDYRSAVKKIIQIAKNQAVQDIIQVPVAAPEAAQ